jgi:hypothetical protein
MKKTKYGENVEKNIASICYKVGDVRGLFDFILNLNRTPDILNFIIPLKYYEHVHGY